MHKFVRSLITEWRKLGLPFVGETIVIAVSGGADSMSLLLAIHDLKKRKKFTHRIIVAHFNHQMRGKESEVDEAFVRNFASDLGMDFVVGYGAGKVTANLEEKARNERYTFLLKVARESGAENVLTAHTVNDQAETFLINLIRGSGPVGLGGMDVARKLDDDGVSLVRPLLRWAARVDTEEFCREQAVMPRTDDMNADERFTRVRIRRTLIPLLAEMNPKIVATLARTADLMRRTNETTSARSNGSDTTNLAIKELKTMKSADLYVVLRAWLRTNRGNLRSLQLKHIEAIERLILSRKSGNTVELPGGGRVVKQAGQLSFTNIKVEK